MWILDFYSETNFLGSVGIENGKLVYSKPSLERLMADPMFKFSLDDPEKAIQEMLRHFTGSLHAVEHGYDHDPFDLD